MIRRIFLASALFLMAASPPPSLSPPADRDASLDPTGGQTAFYPTALLVQRKEGHVTVECSVMIDGTPRNCQVTETVGDPAFATAALSYFSQSRFLPAIRNGAPIETRSRSTATFALVKDSSPTQLKDILMPRMAVGHTPVYPGRMFKVGREGSADVTCHITVEGFTKDCLVLDTSGDTAFGDAALDYASRLRYSPALRHGVPVEVPIHLNVNFHLGDGPSFSGIPGQTPISDQPITGTLNFPAKMLANGREGFVELRCVVTVQSATRDCRVVGGTGDQDFETAAIEMLLQARFAPATFLNKPVEASHYWRLRYGER